MSSENAQAAITVCGSVGAMGSKTGLMRRSGGQEAKPNGGGNGAKPYARLECIGRRRKQHQCVSTIGMAANCWHERAAGRGNGRRPNPPYSCARHRNPVSPSLWAERSFGRPDVRPLDPRHEGEDEGEWDAPHLKQGTLSSSSAHWSTKTPVCRRAPTGRDCADRAREAASARRCRACGKHCGGEP